MCGRYTARLGNAAFSEFFGIDGTEVFLTPRFNAAPTQIMPVVSSVGGVFSFARMRWGLTPSWAHKEKSPPVLINARGETIAEKATFKGLLEQRCLIPADGYYEWLTAEGRKAPYYIHLVPERPLAFAALWQEKEGVASFVIITVDAAPALSGLHHRMPVVLTTRDSLQTWLMAPYAKAQHLLAPSVADFTYFEVAPLVNRAQYDEPSCIKPAV